MTRLPKIERRHFLSSLGAGVIGGLPLLRPERLFAAVPAPKRLLIAFSPGGLHNNRWKPTGSETAYTLTPVLSPLESVKKDVLIMSGVLYANANMHMQSAGLLTGVATGPASTVAVNWGGGVSIDQVVAQKLAGATKLRSLYLSTMSRDTGDASTRIVYQGAGQTVAPMVDPWAAFQAIFEGVAKPGGESAEQMAQRARRLRWMDTALLDARRLEARVNGEERCRLQKFTASLEEVKASVSKVAVAGSCTPPTLSSRDATGALLGKPTYHAQVPRIAQANMDLVVNALQCDVSRVAVLQYGKFGGGGGDLRFPFDPVNVDEPHHELGHLTTPDALVKLERIHKWYVAQLASLVARLKSIPDGAGTMLDSTLLWWTTDGNDAAAHRSNDVPQFLAGGGVRGGRWLAKNAEPHQKLLTSVAHMMGVATDGFGDRSISTGPSSGLT